MSKSSSGLFHGTSGSGTGLEGNSPKRSNAQIKSNSHERIKSWAEKKLDELTGKAKKNFNTACVEYTEFGYGVVNKKSQMALLVSDEGLEDAIIEKMISVGNRVYNDINEAYLDA